MCIFYNVNMFLKNPYLIRDGKSEGNENSKKFNPVNDQVKFFTKEYKRKISFLGSWELHTI